MKFRNPFKDEDGGTRPSDALWMDGDPPRGWMEICNPFNDEDSGGCPTKVAEEAPQMDGWMEIRSDSVVIGGGGSEYPSKMKMSGVAPIKGGRKKSQQTGVHGLVVDPNILQR